MRTNLFIKVVVEHDPKEPPEKLGAELCRQPGKELRRAEGRIIQPRPRRRLRFTRDWRIADPSSPRGPSANRETLPGPAVTSRSGWPRSPRDAQ